METVDVLAEDVGLLVGKEEGQFFDFKSVDIGPASLTKTVSAFANSSGGEILVGFDESRSNDTRKFSPRGYPDYEAANSVIDVIERLGGLDVCRMSFLKIEGASGYSLHIIVPKSRRIVTASNGKAYVRRGAQNLSVDSAEAMRRLELEKGIASFEDETIQIPLDVVTNSVTSLEFLLSQVPNAEPEQWMKSQFLTNDAPTAGSIILFADEPQAVLPKRSGIKIFRYRTSGRHLIVICSPLIQ